MSTDIRGLKGIGPTRLKALNDAGIETVDDLVEFLPVGYRDLTEIVPLAEVQPNETVTVRVRVCGTPFVSSKGKLQIVRVNVSDDTATVGVIWFNQPWLRNYLTQGRELLLNGKCTARGNLRQLQCPTIETEGGIHPVYRETGGISGKTLTGIVGMALEVYEREEHEDPLPESVRNRFSLMGRTEALRQLHFPQDRARLEKARYRITFEQLLLFQTTLLLSRGIGDKGIRIPVKEGETEAFWGRLPFPPTGAQRKTLEEIARNLDSESAMARMVQGDVGSGKTAVAFGAIYLAWRGGFQSALMAPTEVLARQHYEGACRMLEPIGMRVGLLVGSMTKKQHDQAHAAIANGDWDLAIGTHALITEGVEYKNLGLAVTDEQHRFGVRQRTILGKKGEAANVLVMSATPIPRSLSLILYGDLDISIIDEMPPGRQPVRTRIVSEEKRQGMYGFIRKEVAAGHQAYVVCPLVEETDAMDAVSAEETYENLSKRDLKGLRVELVHGRMKGADKDAVLEEFRKGNVDVLVSTTVIEVGVNVPNATIMIIENAERFGLAQLHQLRGRVGRGSQESWCFLMGEPTARMKMLTQTNDGFVIAQKDMEIRGPGDMFGTRQSGTFSLGIGNAAADTRLLKEANEEAKRLMENREDPDTLQIIAYAKKAFEERFRDAALN